MDAQEFDKLKHKHGIDFAEQMRWQGHITAAFNATRPRGVDFRLYTDYAPRIGGKPVKGMGSVELWKPDGASWVGCRCFIAQSADANECAAAVTALFGNDTWPMKE